MKDVIAITYDAGSGGPLLTAQERRQVDTSIFQGPSGTRVYSGVRGGAVSNTGSAVTIAPLTFVIEGSTSPSTLGVYRGAFAAGSAELSKTIAAAHATLPRIDALDVKLYDTDADGSGNRGADIVLTTGTASGSPSTPPLTGSSIRLGTFAVPASGGGSPVFTPSLSLIGYAGAGGTLLVSQRPSSPPKGLRIFRLDTNTFEVYDGTNWRNELGTPWISYSPTWASPGGTMSVGTGGSMSGRWRDEGNMADLKLRLVRGTGAHVGTGVWTWTLPFNVTEYDTDSGTGYYILTSAPANRIPIVWATVAANQIGAWRTTDGLRLGHTGISWTTPGAGDVVVLTGRLEKNQT